MPAANPKPLESVALVWGDDDFAVRQRAREIYQGWCDELGGMDHEIIDAGAGNSGEALKAISRLRESMQTLPFFGTGKVIWFQGCNFLADERTAAARAVGETLGDLAVELKEFDWRNVRLLVTSAKVDKRRLLFKSLEKVGTVEHHPGMSIDDRDWIARAENLARTSLRASGKQPSREALSGLVASVGPNSRMLEAEAEKLSLYVGDRTEVTGDDVTAVVTRNKQARAFALGDALGDRDLPRLLHCLDEEIWSMKLDSQKSEIGLLYGLISKVRVLLLMKEFLDLGWIRPETDFSRFKSQLERVPAGALPDDKRFNPLAMNPYVLFKALSQAGNYSAEELVRAMELLFQCNQQLFSRLDKRIVLQKTLMQIAARSGPTTAKAAPRRPSNPTSRRGA